MINQSYLAQPYTQAKVKNFLEEQENEVNQCENTSHGPTSIFDELDEVNYNDIFSGNSFCISQSGRISGQTERPCNDYHLNLLRQTESHYNVDSYDFENLLSSPPSPSCSFSHISSQASSDYSAQQESNSKNSKKTGVNETDSSQVQEEEQTDASAEELSSQNSKLSRNQFGQKSCEETKNLFILSIPYIISRLKERNRWQHHQDISSLRQKKMNSLQKFNQLLEEIEEKSENNPQILTSFRKEVVEILEHDFVKYATNQKDFRTQVVLLKYLQPIKMIALSQSFTFTSVKYIKKLLDQETRQLRTQ